MHPMQFSIHVQQILMQYYIQLVHETLQGHVNFLIPEKQLAECPVVTSIRTLFLGYTLLTSMQGMFGNKQGDKLVTSIQVASHL